MAVRYLAYLLLGHNLDELGEARRIVSVGFQQSLSSPVDDLVVAAAHPDESQPSSVLALAIRRRPNLVASDEQSQKLIRQFVDAVMGVPEHGPEHRVGLVVAGQQRHAAQLSQLASHASGQMDAPGFFNLIQEPGRFDARHRGRLDQLGRLVERALHGLNVPDVDMSLVQRWTWELLSRLTVQMPRLEPPDESDWSALANVLIQVTGDSDLSTASQLRDRLAFLAGEYSPRAARVDLAILRRDTHSLLDPTIRRHPRGWQKLGGIHRRARDSLRGEISSGDGGRSLCLDRNTAVAELLGTLSGAEAVLVSGESGVGKSALAVSRLPAVLDEEPDRVQVLCINLRQIPRLGIDLETALGSPLSTLLHELSAPERVLVVDGADAAAEDRNDVFRYLLGAACESGAKVVAVASINSKQVVLDALRDFFGSTVPEHPVPPLDDSEVDEIVGTFSALKRLSANPRSRELLRRLVVVDLLVRGRVSGAPVTDADAMNEVWDGLVRRSERSDRGYPDAREAVLLRLADLDLFGGERLDAINGLDSAALDGLRRDGLLRRPADDPFMIGPEFAHDEIRRYAVARLLLVGGNPGSRLLAAGAPRWSLSAAQLACQAWLGLPVTSTLPLTGRFSALQSSFDDLAESNHGSRWGDVPGEAMLTLADPEALLRDAWPALLAEDNKGLKRIARLVHQRLRDQNAFVDVAAVAPIVLLLLEAPAPWRLGTYAEDLLRDWLHGHIKAGTAAGHRLRILLRERLVERCDTGDRRLSTQREAEAAASSSLTPEEVQHKLQLAARHRLVPSQSGYGPRSPRLRREVPYEITDRIVLELLALLGPDLGDEGETILSRVARDAPSRLGPCLESVLTGQALAGARRGILTSLTEAYYLDDESEAGEDWGHDYGVRLHIPLGLHVPHCAWYRGPFMALFRSDFRNGVALLNRLLNHAARIRSGALENLDLARSSLPFDAGPYEVELGISCRLQLYVGDQHVWRWYRGNAVGPDPCFSALQALERVCDQRIHLGYPISSLVSILLEGCANLAIVGLIVGLLVRHLERAERLLDPYLVEPFVWQQEFARLVHEREGLLASPDGLVASERRNWSLQNAAMFMVSTASDSRVAELQALGHTLVDNARRLVAAAQDGQPAETLFPSETTESQLVVQARLWASSLDRDKFQVQETHEGFTVGVAPPEDVVQALQTSNEDLESAHDSIRLFLRYSRDTPKSLPRPVDQAELAPDILSALELLENPPSSGIHDPLDTPTLVAAAALEACLADGAELSDDALSFVIELVLKVADVEEWSRPFEFEGTYNESAADRSAARALPILLLPATEQLRALYDEEHETKIIDRANRGGLNLARAVADEVRLHLARGFDHVWGTSCTEDRPCHHELGWRIVNETMRRSVVGAWDPETGRRSILELEEPFARPLAAVADNSILVSRLDAAIRALAPAVIANNCVSSRAQDLLLVLLAAQRRALLAYAHDGDPDQRGSHTLVSARALLTLAENGHDAAIYEHIDAYADHSTLLEHLLRALSAAGEETSDRAVTAKRIWPNVVRHVLHLPDSGHRPFGDGYFGELALAALIPNSASEICYLYREVQTTPIAWWDPIGLVSEVEAWLELASGNALCVDRLISFISDLQATDQARVGLPWMDRLVMGNVESIAQRTYMLPTWLIQMRSPAADEGFSATWQRIIDALVVAGESKLAPYSR